MRNKNEMNSKLSDMNKRSSRQRNFDLQADDSRQLLCIHRELGIKLNSINSLSEGLETILNATFKVNEIDCGGIYLVDPQTKELNLVIHRGLPKEFIKKASFYAADAPQTKLVMKGLPIYREYEGIYPASAKTIQKEKLKSIAVIPIKHKHDIIGAFNLGSHTHERIADTTRNSVETIAAQIGGIIRQLTAEESLYKEQQNFKSLFDTLQDFLFILDVN